MADFIQKTDTLNEGREKINAAIQDAKDAKTIAGQAVNTSNEAKQIAQTAENKADNVQEQFNQVVIEGDSSVEAAQARVDADGNTFTTLKERLDTKETQFSSQLAHTASDLEQRGVSPKLFGAKADKITDDTNALQAAIDYCIANDLPLALNGEYRISGVTIPSRIKIIGFSSLYPITDNQPYILKLNGQRTSVDGKLTVNGENKALYGVIASDINSTYISALEIINCKVWGFVFDTVGNNNKVQVRTFRGANNGVKHTSSFIKTSFTTGSPGYSTINLTTPLPENLVTNDYDVYFVIINSRPYKVKSVINNQTLEVYHVNIDSGEVTVVIGGAVNIRSYGDNGVGDWGNINLFSNQGIGVNMSALYGHNFNNFVAEGNTIAIGCEDQSFGVNLNRAYFEGNNCDIVAFNYLDGYMHDAIIEYDKIYSITSFNAYGYDLMDRLNITSHKKNLNVSTSMGVDNPSNLILYPTKSYFVTLSDIRNEITFRIQNEKLYRITNSEYINLTLNFSAGADVTFNLVNDNGDTIEGGSTYTINVKGKTHVIITKIGTDWRVTILEAKEYRTSPPLAGTFKKGSIIYNANPVPGGYLGWVCTADGTPGTWKGFGLIEE